MAFSPMRWYTSYWLRFTPAKTSPKGLGKNPPNNIFPCLPKAPPRHRRSTPNRRFQNDAPELGTRVQTMASTSSTSPEQKTSAEIIANRLIPQDFEGCITNRE